MGLGFSSGNSDERMDFGAIKEVGVAGFRKGLIMGGKEREELKTALR